MCERTESRGCDGIIIVNKVLFPQFNEHKSMFSSSLYNINTDVAIEELRAEHGMQST